MSSHLVFRRPDTMSRLSGTESDLQRRVYLIGKQNAASSFAMLFTRQHRGDIDTQPWRHHDDEEVEYIVQGRMQIQVGSPQTGVIDDFEVSSGDLVLMPAGVKHRADSIGDGLCIGLVFCPKPYDLTVGQPAVHS